MKNTALALSVLALVGTAACSSKDKRAEQKAPPTPYQQATQNLGADRDAYVNTTQARIDQMQQFAGDLRNRSTQMDAVQGKKLSNASDDLNSLIADVRKELGDVKAAAPENWLDEKRDVEKTLSRAESQYSNSVTLLR